MSTRELTLLVDGLGFGEGLRWHDDRLWFSDFYAHRVSSIEPGGEPRVEAELDERPSGLGWLPDGRLLVVAMDSRRILRREPDGTLVVHADLSSVATSHANDMVVATDGTAYVGNFGADMAAGEPRTPAQLAIVKPDGTVVGGPDGLAFPNGSVITPDGDHLHRRRVDGPAVPSVPDPGRRHPRRGSGVGRPRRPLPRRLHPRRRRRHLVRQRHGPRGGPCRRRRRGAGCHHHTGPLLRLCARAVPNGRTLFIATASTFPGGGEPDWSGRLWSVEVDVPHAGRP